MTGRNVPSAEAFGATIHNEVAGQGEPLLLIPCLAADNACWALHRARACVHRGHPRVPAGDEPVTGRRGAPGRGLLGLVLAGVLAVVAVALWSAPEASAAPASEAEVALARMYSPVVRLKEQPDSCDIGEPYKPTDVNLLMGNDEVALRGPWDRTNLVKVAPSAADLERGLFDYHLDFPGDALRPGCTYEQWAARLAETGLPPTAYARVVTEAGKPGKLALQYWFFYVYNDWNNKHEGDWEMIQLVFDAPTPAQALTRPPVEVGYGRRTRAPSERAGATRSSSSWTAPTRSSTRQPDHRRTSSAPSFT